MTNQELFNRLSSNKKAQLDIFDNSTTPQWSLETLQNIYSSCGYNYFKFNKDKKCFEHSTHFTPQLKKEGKQLLISAQDCFKLLEHYQIENDYILVPTNPNWNTLSKFSCQYLLPTKRVSNEYTFKVDVPNFIWNMYQYTFSQIYFLIPNEKYETIEKYTYTLFSIPLEIILTDYNKQLRSLIFKASKSTTNNNDNNYRQVYGNINSCMFGSDIKTPSSKNMDTYLLSIKVYILQEILYYFYSKPNNLSIPQLKLIASSKINKIYSNNNTFPYKIREHILNEQRQEIKRQVLTEIENKLKSYQY